MKRLTTFILFLILALVLASCGGADTAAPAEAPAKEEVAAPAEEAPAEEAPAEEAAPTEEAMVQELACDDAIG